MADYSNSGSVVGNYRRYVAPVGEFDIDLMMEKAAALSLREIKETRTSSKDVSCVVDVITSPDEKHLNLFRQRAQIEAEGII